MGIRELKNITALLNPDKYNNIDGRILYYLIFDQKTADDYSSLSLQEIEMKKFCSYLVLRDDTVPRRFYD